jgi:hypothetical protein
MCVLGEKLNLTLLIINSKYRTKIDDEDWQAIQEGDRLRSQLDNYGEVLCYDAQVSDPLKIYLKSDRVTGKELAELLKNVIRTQGIDHSPRTESIITGCQLARV